MDRLLFSELLANPQDVSLEHKDDLIELIKKYPYFQAPQVLLALSDRTDTEQVKRAAAYSVNRSMLKTFINEDFNTNVNLHNARKLDIQANAVNAFEELADKPNYTEEISIEPTIEETDTTTEEVINTHVEEEIVEEENTITEEENTNEDTRSDILEEENTTTEEDEKNEGVLAFLLSNVEEEEKSEELHDSLFSEKEDEDTKEEEDEAPLFEIEDAQEDELIIQDDDLGEVWTSQMLHRWKGLQQMREELKEEEEEEEENQKPKENHTPHAKANEEELPLFNPFGKENTQHNKNVNTNDSWTFELNKELFPEHLKELVEKEEKMELEEKKLLINNFINEKPRINIDKTQIHQEIKDLSGQTSNHFLFRPSENFAKILVKQGKYKEAIHIYEELILKNPDKKPYFAGCISEIKKGS